MCTATTAPAIRAEEVKRQARHPHRRSGIRRDAARRRRRDRLHRAHPARRVHLQRAVHRRPRWRRFQRDVPGRLRAGDGSRRQAGAECACDDEQLGRPVGVRRQRLRGDGGERQWRRHGAVVEYDLRSDERRLGGRRPRLGGMRRRRTVGDLGGHDAATASRWHALRRQRQGVHRRPLRRQTHGEVHPHRRPRPQQGSRSSRPSAAGDVARRGAAGQLSGDDDLHQRQRRTAERSSPPTRTAFAPAIAA